MKTLVGLVLFVLGVWLVPHRWCARESARWYAGDPTLQDRLARGVERWVTNELTRSHFTTGSDQFNGEWLFGSYLMAGFGFGQTAANNDRHRQLLTICIDRIMSPEVRAFDKEIWGNDPLDSLDTDSDHAAYLGYFNLLLSLHRALDPTSKYAALNDRITAALVRRIERSPTLLLHSYPNEVYPVDNCAVIASIGLHDRSHDALLQRWAERCRRDYIDRATGLLYQCVDPGTGKPADDPRGSGTALAIYFLSFSDPALSRELFQALQQHLARNCLGFGVVREYPATVKSGRGDIDSGPVLFGWSISATGFAIAGSRIHGDPVLFDRLCRTAYLFGAPCDHAGRRDYVMGGPLGNAIMFAMLTAKRSTP